MNNLEKRIATMSNDQLIACRSHFDCVVDIPKKHPAEFEVLIALNSECLKRGIEW